MLRRHVLRPRHRLRWPRRFDTKRASDLGFVAGTRIRCIKRAPLGDPVAYDVRGTHLCLRRSESDRVRVRRD